MYLYKVAFVAGSEKTGGIRFEAWVTADCAENVDRVCQAEVQPLQIAFFEYKNRFLLPQMILINKSSVRRKDGQEAKV